MSIGHLLDAGGGILRLAPTWVPRAFGSPGRRLRLHPDDDYALGPERCGISERWLASTVRADNGPLTGRLEGISMVVGPDGDRTPLDEVVAFLGPLLIGDRLWAQHAGWPVLAKLFDYAGPLPFHVHHDDRRAALVGKSGKPEAYYYPVQLNPHLGTRPVSYLGLRPDTTRADLRDRLQDFGRGGDNRITELSLGYRARLGEGWDIPAGVLHAPASLCTYEPQAASDVLSMWESRCAGESIPETLLWRDLPVDQRGDAEAALDLLDWERNVSATFVQERRMIPVPTAASAAEPDGPSSERWIAYRSPAFSATELVVAPGATVDARAQAAYGCLVVQGRGTLGGRSVATPTLLRYGQLSDDEFLVSEARAREGVRVVNDSRTEPLVILKHFGPGNPEVPPAEVAIATVAGQD